MNSQQAEVMSEEISDIFTAAGLEVTDSCFSMKLSGEGDVNFRFHFTDGMKWLGHSVQDAIDYVASLQVEALATDEQVGLAIDAELAGAEYARNFPEATAETLDSAAAQSAQDIIDATGKDSADYQEYFEIAFKRGFKQEAPRYEVMENFAAPHDLADIIAPDGEVIATKETYAEAEELAEKLNKRQITAHKGNRDDSLYVRLTAQEKALIVEAARKAGKKQADFILMLVNKHLGKIGD